MIDQLPAFLQEHAASDVRTPVKASTTGFSGLPGNFTRTCRRSKL